MEYEFLSANGDEAFLSAKVKEDLYKRHGLFFDELNERFGFYSYLTSIEEVLPQADFVSVYITPPPDSSLL